MRSLPEQLRFEVPGRRGFVNITDTVASLARKSGVKEDLCLVNAMHITASVFINDDESGLHHDYEVWLERRAPHAPTTQYHHNRTGEDNAAAHLKRQITWVRKLSLPSRRGASISVFGNKSSMASSMATAVSGCS